MFCIQGQNAFSFHFSFLLYFKVLVSSPASIVQRSHPKNHELTLGSNEINTRFRRCFWDKTHLAFALPSAFYRASADCRLWFCSSGILTAWTSISVSSDEWFLQLVTLMTPPEDTFIDRKSFKSLLASHLRLLSPEMKVCILFKCEVDLQGISPLAHLGLQKHHRTALNSHIKKFWKQLKSFPRLSTVLCTFENRIF